MSDLMHAAMQEIEKEEAVVKQAVETLLRFATGVPEGSELREGLQETPERVLRAFREWFDGYNCDVTATIKSFRDGAERGTSKEMVIVQGIPVFSHCEHHLAPIFGVVHIGYIPNGAILGLSKFKRITDIFARRLQVQERLTSQIADALNDSLEPLGVAVIVEARHMCMESRGVNTPGSITKTTALRGVFDTEQKVREEFLMHLARK